MQVFFNSLIAIWFYYSVGFFLNPYPSHFSFQAVQGLSFYLTLMSDVNLMHFLTGEHGNNSVLEMEWRQKRISTTVPSFKSLLLLLGRHLHEEPEESGVKSLNASGCQDRNFQSPRLAHRFIHDMGCRVIKCWTHLSNLRSNDLSMLQKIRSGHNCAQEITSAHIRETMPLQRDNAEGCPI